MTGRILIVDDEPKIGALLKRALEADGLEVVSLDDPERGLQTLKEESFDIVVTDLRMPRIDGLELLRRAKAIRPGCEIVLMTAHATVATAREALKRGAVDYITKPFSVEGELKPLISSILSSAGADEGEPLDSTRPRRSADELRVEELEGVVGASGAMRALIDKVRKVARSEAPVLLRGESGTGKEVFASLIHRLGPRNDRPLVKINCAALPETLLESELFGYVKGAFTGANQDREGLFQAAHGGTIFLDEIGEISASFQPKLLRVLQDGEFHRIGESRRTVRVDVRVIAATNRDLEEAVRSGHFRKDLYYRLSVVPLLLPPLRERMEDLPELLAHFAQELGKDRTVRFSDEAMRAMSRYDWPGNIREVANAVEYAIVLGDSTEVQLSDLPLAIQDDDRIRSEASAVPAATAEAGTLEEIEMRCILQAMARTAFNRTRAAQLLGITRRTLGYRIAKYGLEDDLEAMRRGELAPPGSDGDGPLPESPNL